MNARKIKISHHTGEGACTHCGYPLYVGDAALTDDHGVYCSRTCEKKNNATVCTSCGVRFGSEIDAEDPEMAGTCKGCAGHLTEMRTRGNHGVTRTNESHNPEDWTITPR